MTSFAQTSVLLPFVNRRLSIPKTIKLVATISSTFDMPKRFSKFLNQTATERLLGADGKTLRCSIIPRDFDQLIVHAEEQERAYPLTDKETVFSFSLGV